MKPPVSSVTVSIPLASLEAAGVVVHAPPPAMVTKMNCERHLGITERQFLDALRAMRRDPRFAADVIATGKIRGAPPERVLAFLRASTRPAETMEPANEVTSVESHLSAWGVV